MGSDVKFNIFLRLLTNDILFLSPLKSPIIAHLHHCLDMFEGEVFNKHSKNMGLKTFLIECF